MQAKLDRGKAAFSMRHVGLSVAILAGATLSICVSSPALAACGISHPSGVHASGGAGGVHVATSATAVPHGGGATASGCSPGASAPALRGLTTAASGRVVETGAHASHPMTHARTAATRTTNAGAHLHAVRPAHRA